MGTRMTRMYQTQIHTDFKKSVLSASACIRVIRVPIFCAGGYYFCRPQCATGRLPEVQFRPAPAGDCEPAHTANPAYLHSPQLSGTRLGSSAPRFCPPAGCRSRPGVGVAQRLEKGAGDRDFLRALRLQHMRRGTIFPGQRTTGGLADAQKGTDE